MKNSIKLAVIFVMILTLTSCGSKDTDSLDIIILDEENQLEISFNSFRISEDRYSNILSGSYYKINLSFDIKIKNIDDDTFVANDINNVFVNMINIYKNEKKVINTTFPIDDTNKFICGDEFISSGKSIKCTYKYTLSIDENYTQYGYHKVTFMDNYFVIDIQENGVKYIKEDYSFNVNFYENQRLLNENTYIYDSMVRLHEYNKKGYSFVGWYTEPEFINKYTFDNFEREDLDLYAKWSIKSFTLKFLDYDNGIIKSQTVQYGQSLNTYIPSNLSRTGYTFNGWDINIPNSMPDSNLTLKARYQINSYILSFEMNGGTEIDSVTKTYSSKINLPTNPIKEGHTFDGWYLDQSYEKSINYDTMPANNVVLYAKWIVNLYEMTFLDDKGNTLFFESIYYGTNLDNYEYPEFPEKEGHLIEGWSLEIPEKMPSKNLIIEVVYSYQYIIIDDYVKIVDYHGSKDNLIIPSQIEELDVIIIGSRAFYKNSLKSIVLPSKITEIEEYAFSKNSIQLVIFPESIKVIGHNSFQENNLNEVTIPEGVEMIGALAFSGNNITKVTIPSTVTLSSRVFYGNKQNMSVVFNEGVTTIFERSFEYARVVEITLPSTLILIEQEAFENNALTEVTIPEGVEMIGALAFSGNNITNIYIEGIQDRFNERWVIIGFDIKFIKSND